MRQRNSSWFLLRSKRWVLWIYRIIHLQANHIPSWSLAAAIILKPYCLPATISDGLFYSRVQPVSSCLGIGVDEMDKLPLVSSVQWMSILRCPSASSLPQVTDPFLTNWVKRRHLNTSLGNDPRLHDSSLQPSCKYFCLLDPNFHHHTPMESTVGYSRLSIIYHTSTIRTVPKTKECYAPWSHYTSHGHKF